MIFDFRVYVLIGVFMTVCISLIIFNFVVIRYGRKQSAPSTGIIENWKGILNKQTAKASDRKHNESKHEKFLIKKLSGPENLIAYSHALQHLKNKFPNNYKTYIKKRRVAFQKLADTYNRKSSIERTCFADFICNFPQIAGGMYGQLAGTLISYMDDSTVHCRTTVLRALCNIGSAKGVVNALQVINEKSLFIHNLLLTNALSNFKGDKEILMESLWNGAPHWNDNIMVSIIHFITKFSNNYSEMFLPILQDSSINSEVRIAVIRYYRKHMYAPARPILTKIAANFAEADLAAEAAFALRKNEMPAPVKLVDENNLQEVLQDDSDYAKEMLAYMLGLKGTYQNIDLLKEMDGEKLSA